MSKQVISRETGIRVGTAEAAPGAFYHWDEGARAFRVSRMFMSDSELIAEATELLQTRIPGLNREDAGRLATLYIENSPSAMGYELRDKGWIEDYVITGHCPDDGDPQGYLVVRIPGHEAAELRFWCTGLDIYG